MFVVSTETHSRVYDSFPLAGKFRHLHREMPISTQGIKADGNQNLVVLVKGGGAQGRQFGNETQF